MFFNPKVSVTYNVRLKRARAQFKVGECLKSRRPPADALDKAREKLEEELEDGHIEYFEVFEKKFHALWHHIRAHGDQLPPDKEVRFTLAQGARAYSELMVQRSRDPGQLALLSCLLSERKAKNLFFSAFVFHIVRQLQNLGIHEKVDGAQLRFIYLLMKAGQQIERWPLKAAPHAEHYPKQKLLVDKDPQHHYVALHIFDARLLQDVSQCEKIYLHALNSFKDKADSLTWLKDHTIEKLRSLNNKVQSLGFGLPYSLLIAYDSQYRLDVPETHEDKPLAKEANAEELPRWKVRVGALMRRQKSDYVELDVDETRMKAVVKLIHPKALAALKDQLTSDWLLHECHKQGVVFGYEKFLDPVVEALKAGQNPVGMQIAEGQAAKAGLKPYLHLSYRDPPVLREGQSDDVRERQNTRLVTAGQLIAEVRYDDGIPGRNVFGEDTHAIGSALEARISAGESVQLQGPGQFVATRDGLIESDSRILRIVQTYVHKGSVNLSSGNLAFDGAVVVKGDIEAGATVQVKGTLVVEGVIGHATVKVGGDLEVTGGIITSQQGLVVVGGSCLAQFIENSRLHVKGRLDIKKSILNSEIVCGGPLIVRDRARGVISGGAISCWSAMAVRHLGLAQGHPTICRIGTHYATEIRWQRMNQRWRVVHEYRDAISKHLKDVSNNPQGRKPADVDAQRQALQQRLQKTEKVLAHIQKRRDLLEKQMKWNPNATLVVRGILDRQVYIEAAGKKIKADQNLQGVLITASPYRGSSLHDLSVWDEFHKTCPDARLADVS
jgi:uncharacterized protein (DUF342 family)